MGALYSSGNTGPVSVVFFRVLGDLCLFGGWICLYFLKGSVTSNTVFWGTYRFGMALVICSVLGSFVFLFLLMFIRMRHPALSRLGQGVWGGWSQGERGGCWERGLVD